MKKGVFLAALALLIPAVSAVPQGHSSAKPPKPDPKAEAKIKEELMNPAALKEKAPETFKVKFETTKGDFIVDVNRSWSPNGVDRFYNLVKHHFYDGVKFFRVVPDFVVQFGMHGDPEVEAKWHEANIPDDKVVQSNKRGYLTFAKTDLPNTRTTQLFINLQDNARLDGMGFSAFGKVSKGMEVVEKINSEYGQQPRQGQIMQEGNKYLEKNFPKLDGIKKASILK